MRALLALSLLWPAGAAPGACPDGSVPLFDHHTITQSHGYIRMTPTFACPLKEMK